ncbi:MAG TPA: hypothetical protein VJR22_00770 [Candidatus Nitrosotalea sp.]|nr:hypothetical protein [Nitrososphaerota archaeon]HKU32363.1 hypothetical protein [Candidatus Nitrosotalea sp.]
MDRVDSNNTVFAIAKVFREYIDYANYLTSENSYKSALSKLENLKFTMNDVSTFAGLIDREQFTAKANYWTVGLFISAAINKVITKGDVMMLDFAILDYPVDCIGYRLEQGNITLQGDAGDYLGENMSGGEITIRGNAGNYVGYAMSGGEITIQGNAMDHIGTYMSGGIIHVKGEISSISESCKGRIYRGITSLR